LIRWSWLRLLLLLLLLLLKLLLLLLNSGRWRQLHSRFRLAVSPWSRDVDVPATGGSGRRPYPCCPRRDSFIPPDL
jgi:hypothetical protein